MNTRRFQLILTCLVLVLVVAPAAGAAGTKRPFSNCKAVDAKYSHGIAKSSKVVKTASGLSGRPFVSARLYALEHGLDRDEDGVACET
jgi:hypothetical protein